MELLLHDTCFVCYWPLAALYIVHVAAMVLSLRWLTQAGKWFLLINLVTISIYIVTSSFFYFNVQLNPSPSRIMALVDLSYILNPPFAFFIGMTYLIYGLRALRRKPAPRKRRAA